MRKSAFSVRFGTPEPVPFTQVDRRLEAVGFEELELSARFAGTAEVSDYDAGAYGGAEAVKTAVQTNALRLLERSLAKLPEGVNLIRGDKNGVLAALFDRELAELGITAKTAFTSIAPTEEAEQLYRTAMEQYGKSLQSGGFGWDHISAVDDNGNPVRQPSPLSGTILGVDNPMYLPRSPFTGMGGPVFGENLKPDSVDVCAPDWTPKDGLSMGQVCRKCGYQKTGSERFCPNCGERLP